MRIGSAYSSNPRKTSVGRATSATKTDIRSYTALCIPGEIRGRLPKKHSPHWRWDQADILTTEHDAAGLPRLDRDVTHHTPLHGDHDRPCRSEVEEHSDLACRCCHGILLPDTPGETPIERAKRSIASSDRDCSQSQQRCRSAGKSTCSRQKHFAT